MEKMTEEEVKIILENATTLAELSIFHNIKMFIEEVLPRVGEDSSTRMLAFKEWINMSVERAEQKLKGEKNDD